MTAAGTAAPSTGRNVSIRTRLTLLLLPFVFLGVVLTGAASYFRARAILRQEAEARLSLTARNKLRPILDQAEALEQWLASGAQRADLRAAIDSMSGPRESGDDVLDPKDRALAVLLDLQSSETQELFTQVVLAEAVSGRVLVSTVPSWEGVNLTAITERRLPSSAVATTPLYSDPVFAPSNVALVTSAPIRPLRPGAAQVLLLGVNTDLHVGAIMREMLGVWELRGFHVVEPASTFLALEPDVVLELSPTSMIPTSHSGMQHPVFEAIDAQPSGTFEYVNPAGDPVLAAYEWLPDWRMGVVVELPQSEILGGLNSLALFVFVVLLGVGSLTALVVTVATGRMLRPLANLTVFAERLSQGDLGHRVESTRRDEIGRLGSTLNFMADELSGFYTSLERKVEERTRQIRTAADVAKEAAAIRNVDQLLGETVRVIASRFGYYHAGVYLVDAAGEHAVLRAASSAGGQRLLAKGHQLPVGKVGLVGYVTGTGNSRMAVDVGADAVHFANPDLPDTRSELAVPLRLGDRLIGALDVQSVEPNAFREEDVLVLQTIADQLAVAIEHARLLEHETHLADQRRKVLGIYQTLTEQLSYDHLLTALAQEIRRSFGFRVVSLGLVEGDQVVIRSAAAADPARLPRLGESIPIGRGLLGRAVALRSKIVERADSALGEGRPSGSSLAVPLLSRGHVLGALAVESDESAESLEGEVANVELLARQAAVSLENARLIEETQANLHQLDTLYRQQAASAWSERLASRRTRQELTRVEFGRSRFGDGDGQERGELDAAIQLRGEVIGKLSLEPARTGEWTDEEQQIVSAVADEVADALEQVRLMEEVQQRAAQLQAAAEIARESTGVLNLDTLLRRAVTLIRERIGSRSASIILLDGQGGMRGVAADALHASPVAHTGATELDDLTSLLLNRVTQSGKNELLPDLSAASGGALGTGSALGVPLRSGPRVIGLLRVEHDLAHAFGADDVAVFEVIADQLAVAVQNARLFEETLQRAEREQSVIEISSRIRASADPESMLQTALREMRRALSARRARVVRHTTDPLPADGPGDGAAARDGRTLSPSGDR